MRKLFFAAVATAIVALQPSLALAQRTPSDFVKTTPGASSPTTQNFGPFLILQTIPVTASAAGLPALPTGVQPTGFCIGGTATGIAPGTFENIRFVGNVLCLDPGPLGNFASFAQNCSPVAGVATTPVIQGIKLFKTIPRVPKCPDVYPGGAFVQTPDTTGIRTWWTLKFTPCNTEFRLEVEFACVSAAGPNRGQVVAVRVNKFTFRVTITPGTLAWVIEALHNEELGLCEIPCITDEGLRVLLLNQADAINRNAQLVSETNPTAAVNLNNAFDAFEATVVRNATFIISVAQVTRDAAGNITSISPCGTLFPNGPPGNSTISIQGTGGIVDTLENPCACKLIADLVCLKNAFIGTDP